MVSDEKNGYRTVFVSRLMVELAAKNRPLPLDCVFQPANVKPDLTRFPLLLDVGVVLNPLVDPGTDPESAVPML
jgi:hypothetical protein